jgi:hypothetical protein
MSELPTTIRCQRHASLMPKDRPKNLELPLPGNAKAAPARGRRKARTAPARSSRRQLLLFDYQSWLTLMAELAEPAVTAEASRTGRR